MQLNSSPRDATLLRVLMAVGFAGQLVADSRVIRISQCQKHTSYHVGMVYSTHNNDGFLGVLITKALPHWSMKYDILSGMAYITTIHFYGQFGDDISLVLPD